MQQLFDFLGIKDLIPHGYCLSWSPVLLWLNVISDLFITLAYYSIPLTIIYYFRQRKDLSYPWLMAMFSGFIVACGTTHLLSAITIWIPLYWVDAIVKGFTAILSVTTAIMMLWITPRALSLPTIHQLQNEIQNRKGVEEDLKNTQLQLLEKQRMLAESQRIAHIGSWSLDLATGVLKWSDEMYAIFGVTPETFDHTPDAIDHLIHPEDLNLRNNWLSECLKGNKVDELIFRIRLPDDEIRFICTHGELQYDSMNNPLHLVGSTQDISERKNKEIKDKQHLDQLAHVTRLGLMGELASGIAHEVNQPLTAIATYAQVSLNMIKKEDPDLSKLAEIAAKTQEQALRAGQIIHRMRRLCTFKSQQLSTIAINELINDSVGLCVDPLTHNSIEVIFFLEDNLPHLHVDYIQIEQVIVNLIRNSIDAILGVTDRQQGQINIKSHLTDNNEIQVSVKDNGGGIEEDQKANILMPFHTTKENGMGMGLSISRSLIEAHDGTLSFNSEFGKGCTFYFTLPIPMAQSLLNRRKDH